MASTRHIHQLDMYPDPYQYHSDVPSEYAFVTDASAHGNLIIAPSLPTQHSAASPRKADHAQHPSVTGTHLAARSLNTIHIPPPLHSNLPGEIPHKSQMYHQQPIMRSDDMYGSYSHQSSADKENVYQAQLMTPQQTMYGYKAPMKRTFSSDGPVSSSQRSQSGGKKQKLDTNGSSFVLPDPSEMPDIEDDGTKPSLSYANLIGMAILRAPQRRLTLAQIYKWISDHFKFYRVAEAGWQNSIRHNLSLNKNFIKQERPKDDPGKGNYWIIKPGEERTFIVKDRPLRPVKSGENPTFVQHDFAGGSNKTATPAVGSFTLAPSSNKRHTMDSSKFPEDNLSSDGTIPASDPALHDEEQNDSAAMPPPASRNIRSSPPAQDICSSPPPYVSDRRAGTPPGMKRTGSRKSNSQANDSGYFSSIESSAPRPLGGAVVAATSETDRPRHKRGRAEEELARIRSSSYDSPSKDVGHRRKISVHFDVTSPKRPGTSTGLAPATPAGAVFKRPALPPASISPNTNLKNHRARMQTLLGDSPGKSMTPLRESWTAWSPHFSSHAEQDLFMSPDKTLATPVRESMFSTAAFEAFDFHSNEDLAARGSPGKRRPTMNRAVTSSGILAGITGGEMSRNGMNGHFDMACPPFKLTPGAVTQRSNALGISPLRSGASEESPEWLDLNVDSLFGYPSPARPDGTAAGVAVNSDGSEEGLDILQEFGKIGSNAANRFAPSQGSPIKRSHMSRPSLGRSATSRF